MIIKLKQKPSLKYKDALLVSYAKFILPITSLLVITCYFFLDKTVTLYLHDNAPFLKKIGSMTSDLFSPFTIICAGPILFFINKLLWKKEKMQEISQLLIFAAPLSFVAAKIIKNLTERYRPKKLLAEGMYGFYSTGQAAADYSFPSGHACAIGALAGTLSCFYPKYTWYFISGALFLSLSRVIKLDHFLSDVLIGILIGGYISQLIHIYMKKKKIHL